ncbi:MAG: hypothetical protein ABI977_25045 [Acidobacteriota bacterium]
MNCPQCGQQPPTEQTRYCTHCGFALGPLKEFMATGTLPGATRQRDITLGAGLMLVGAVKAALITLAMNEPQAAAIAIMSMMAGGFFGLLQLFFQLSPRQKGLSLGATLMFLGALAGLMAGLPTEGAGTFAVIVVAIPMILFWKRLAAGFSKVFFDKSESDGHRAMLSSKPVAALPPPQAAAVDFDTDRMKQAAAFNPPSVIEGTTKTLAHERLSESSS